jgi:hypothetical protein
MAERKPWERRDDESDRNFEAFAHYRDLGAERTIKQTAQDLGKSEGYCEQLSGRFGWVGRALAWDDEQDRRKREAQADEIEKMSRRHAREIEATMAILGQPARELARRLQSRDLDLTTIDSADLFALVRDAARSLPNLVTSERLVRGVSTQNLAGHDGGPLADAPLDEVEAYLLGLDDGYRRATGEDGADERSDSAASSGSNGTH